MSNKIGRKITRIDICPNHVSWFVGVTHRRMAEVFDEGGPGRGIYSQACHAKTPCRIWPGRDFFVASVCDSEADWPKTWAVNRVVTP